MIKIFRMLSVMFALLAGFSACGTAHSENDEDKMETYDESVYGAIYSSYNIKISGTVKNEADKGLENITVGHPDYTSIYSVKTNEYGEFVYKFTEEEYDGHSDLQVAVSLKLKDDGGVYKEKEKEIDILCVNTTPDKVWDAIYDCKKEGVEIILKKIGDEEPDEYENPDTDDQSTEGE